MELIKEALERNGFTYVSPCSVCGGRGFKYRRNRAEATIKKDQHMKEVSCNLEGFRDNGTRIVLTRIDAKNKLHLENLDQLIQSNLGLNGNQEETSNA
jgi:hypothetical protein